MTWHRVWVRTFSTEEEADVAYDRLARAQEFRLPYLVVDVDRFDGNTIAVAYSDTGLDKMARTIEESYQPPTDKTLCTCGHRRVLHDHENPDDPCHICTCAGFDRADWPPDQWSGDPS